MKNKIIKASEELFPVKDEMSLDEQSEQILRQIGFKLGASWAIDKACEWLNDYLPSIYLTGMDSVNEYQIVKMYVEQFKKDMEGGEQ